ncbi:MAG TPA: hypothetical protein VGL09_03415 [Methylomirabilota bacterium]
MTIVTARDGDTLCGIAIDAGFLDCELLRAEAANAGLLNRGLQAGDQVTVPDRKTKHTPKATDARHRFIKRNSPPVSIRYVHGSPDKKYLLDDTLPHLNVSNFVTNKGGPDGTHAFPAGFGFDADGHADEDTFKVEVVDPAAGGSVNVLLEALKRVVKPDGSIEHQPITGVPDAARRKVDPLECKQVRAGHVAFRSRYMRLVVDDDDFNAAPGQTLLTTDLVDAGDEAVEILDQRVRSTYVIQRCPGTGGRKCQVTTVAEIGTDRKRVKIAAQILKDPGTGTAVATVDQTRKSCLKYIRQLYAQANMSVKIVAPIREVPAPANMFAIADGNGQPAVGGQTVRVRVRIDAGFDETLDITTVPGDAPFESAKRLADEINKALGAATPPVAAVAAATQNPPLIGQAIGSADVLVGDPRTQKIRLNVITSNDAGHPVTVARITTTTVVDFNNANMHVGTAHERVLLKNYDTGRDRVDLFIVEGLSSGALGEAFPPFAPRVAGPHPLDTVVNSAIVTKDPVVKKDHFHTTIPHELGHTLMDVNNSHAVPVIELLTNGSPVGSNERVVNGPKRISDLVAPNTVAFDNGMRGNPVTLLRTANAAVVDAF